MGALIVLAVVIGLPLLIVLFFIAKCIVSIGPNEVGLVTRRWGSKLPGDNPVALRGEAGYQANLLMPGLRKIFWPRDKVKHYPWVQIPAGEIGVVVAQVGQPLPQGAKSAVYRPEFQNFSDLTYFMENGGQKGVQRPVLPPGSLLPIHPIGFLVITREQVYGQPIGENAIKRDEHNRIRALNFADFGLNAEQLKLYRIEPMPTGADGKVVDTIGIVTVYEGLPLPSGYIASRLGEFEDITQLETAAGKDAQGNSLVHDADLVEKLLGNKNSLHNNYQDFQAFLDQGGRIGLQYDPLLYGAYALNPFLVKVETVPMLVIKQGEVAVVKAYVGLSTEDTSGATFKFGSLVHPGHRGIWQEPLRTGKYAINPRCYQAEIVPTFILTLNWAKANSTAHDLDKGLSQIVAKSTEGFPFGIDLQVQIHVPDTRAPRVISTVGTMLNLVNEVLQAAVGNHFRDKLQGMKAIDFIEKRAEIQQQAQDHITAQLNKYDVETKGVYIQDVILPEQLVAVRTDREIANQQDLTYKQQKIAQDARVDLEASRGRADMQQALAKSAIGVDIKTNEANARKQEAEGDAAYISRTGEAQGAQIEAVGMARAKAYKEQVNALGPTGTMFVNVANALSEGKNKFVPDVLVAGGGGGSLDAFLGNLTQMFRSGSMRMPSMVETASQEQPTKDGGKQHASETGLPVMAPATPKKDDKSKKSGTS